MSLFSSFFNSVHSEAKIWMQNYVRRYNRTQTDHWMSQGRTSEFIKTELQRKNHRQWATFNGYYSLVKTITFLVLFTLICFTLYGYHCWGGGNFQIIQNIGYPSTSMVYWGLYYFSCSVCSLLCLILPRELSLPFTNSGLISNPRCLICGVIRVYITNLFRQNHSGQKRNTDIRYTNIVKYAAAMPMTGL